MKKLILILVALVAVLPSSAFAAPSNDDVYTPTEVHSLPFEETSDLTNASRDRAGFRDCIPSGTTVGLPQTYADVWYRVFPTSTYFDVVAQNAETSPVVGIFRHEPGNNYSGDCHTGYHPDDPAAASTWVNGTGSFWVEIALCVSCVTDRTVHVRITEPTAADLSIDALTWAPVYTSTPAGDAPKVISRDVKISLSAPTLESGPSTANWIIGACDTETECFELGHGHVTMAEGEHVDRTIRWDALGQAGDFYLCARLDLLDHNEKDWRNNRIWADAWIGLGNTGIGLAPGQDDQDTYWWCW